MKIYGPDGEKTFRFLICTSFVFMICCRSSGKNIVHQREWMENGIPEFVKLWTGADE